jgi:2-oxoglutarate ferredoxin oxidoreductase subunit gamma
MRTEIRISGFGGQGVALAGYIIGKAASLYQGLEAAMTQAHGPEARGGASSSDIVIADGPIDYPFVQQADILVTLSQEAYTRFRPDARPEAMLIVDAGLVTPFSDDRPLIIPATQLAEEMGRRIVANVVMLGYFTAVTGLLQRQAVEKAIETSVRPNSLSLNLEAFSVGYEYASVREHSG